MGFKIILFSGDKPANSTVPLEYLRRLRFKEFKTKSPVVKQQAETQAQNEKIEKLSEIVKFLAKENEIHIHAVERLLKESKERETKQ